MRLDVYRRDLIDHAQKLGYHQPVVVDNLYWKFIHPNGAAVFALYDVEDHLLFTLMGHSRQAKRNLTMRAARMRDAMLELSAGPSAKAPSIA